MTTQTETRRAAQGDDAITAGDRADVQRVALAKAKEGDTVAAALIERMWRERAVTLDLPPIADAQSVAEAQGRVIAAVADGRITPRQGLGFATIIEWRRRALETVEIERRLQEVEANIEARRARGGAS